MSYVDDYAMRRSVTCEQGFTLIELLIVMVVLGILVLIAVPAYLSFRASAELASAESNVRSAIPATEGYYLSAASYSGMTTAKLQKQAPGLSLSHVSVSADGYAYCIDSQYSGPSYESYYIGGDENIASDHHGFVHDTGVKATVTGGHACADVVSG